MGFWEGETCEYCDGAIVEKHVDIPRKVGGQYVFLEQVPVGVCRKCGTRYYAANVLKMIEETVRRRRKTAREVVMPVYSLEAAKTVVAVGTPVTRRPPLRSRRAVFPHRAPQ